MISAPIHDMTGKEVGTYEFDPADLAPGINKQLLHDAVVMYESNRRVGTAQTKSRAVVAGSKKKMYRQKGTGRARAGNRRTPVRRGGGHAFAKVPKDWSYRMPKKAIRLATRMALLSKFQDGEAIVVDKLALTEAKTKSIVAMLKALGVSRQTCLLTIAGANSEIWRSARNIPTVQVAPAGELNAYDLLHQKRLVITREAIDQLRGKE
ncbi:MAG: 50S ribosomal protein L4 [Planctomycetaceae bacterium]|nr:50S ribosomal protein L4 [Planctomycetaceae bacterium]